MRRSLSLPLAALVLLCALAAPAVADDAGLVATLVSKLGITEAQAAGGAKAVFGLAKGNLSTEEMGQLASAVPEVSSLLGEGASAASGAATAAAPVSSQASNMAATAAAALGSASGGTSGGTAAPAAPASGAAPPAAAAPAGASAPAGNDAMGAVTAMAASAGGDLGKLAGLASSFSDLGMDAGMVKKFVPVVVDYVGAKSGGAAALLEKGLGM